jgi:hypothetical protein
MNIDHRAVVGVAKVVTDNLHISRQYDQVDILLRDFINSISFCSCSVLFYFLIGKTSKRMLKWSATGRKSSWLDMMRGISHGSSSAL